MQNTPRPWVVRRGVDFILLVGPKKKQQQQQQKTYPKHKDIKMVFLIYRLTNLT